MDFFCGNMFIYLSFWIKYIYECLGVYLFVFRYWCLLKFLMMKELDRFEVRKGSLIGIELRIELIDVEFDFLISMRFWGGEVKGEDWWRIELLMIKLGVLFLYD